ncbi:hypothetical protein GF391_01110 [Candidatus Uhrbacteria bacterium]|nr:hypothetical protein [Candidatus Uhrbacteria bacterium]
MKKIWSVLLSILLGALVVGIGTGYFLYLANKDRQTLAAEANRAKLEAREAMQASQQAIEEANSKLQAANEQVLKAEQALKALKNQQALLKDAEPLIKPSNKNLEGWTSHISTSHGVSLFTPPGNTAKVNNDIELSIKKEDGESPWLKINNYSSALEKDYTATMSSSTEVAYFIDGKLVAGISGNDKETQNKTALLKIYENGTSTKIFWIKTPPKFKLNTWSREQTSSIENILRTIEFEK